MGSLHVEGPKAGKTDLWTLFPEQIICDDSQNGRHDPHDAAAVLDMAYSILAHGQQQPVVVRRVEGNKVQLVLGYRRYKAVQHINTELQRDNPIKLTCRLADCNEEEGFVRNIVENHERSECTPIDNAHNVRRLSEVYQWDDERILKLYHRTAGWLAQVRKLLQLPTKTQEAVATGKVTLSAALDLVDLPAKEQAKVIEETTGTNGKVSTGEVRKKVREKKIEGGDGKGKARTMKEVRLFFDQMTAQDTDEPLKSIAHLVLEFISGTITDRQTWNRLDKLFAGEKK
jgi:ParB/RepB/Spo0J family partition protein